MGNATNQTRQQIRGFTIVELLIVVVVIAILAAVTIASYAGITAQANDSRVRTAASQASKEIQMYSVTASGDPYPTAGALFKACTSEGIVCDYRRTDYSDLDSGETVRGYELLLCDTKAAVRYTVSGTQANPRKMQNANELVPMINSPANMFSSPGMVITAMPSPIGQIYAYTGQTVPMNVALRPCTILSQTSFQWQSRANASASWTNIAGATSPTYTTPVLNSSYDGRYYRVVLTNAYGSTASNHASLIMDYEP